MEKYDHVRIERKWQEYWESRQTFKAEVDHQKPKYYVLDMFPYPSGAGLHVGHVTGYTATDVIARFKRQKGFNVLHPMGWDSFGLPAEQYAIRTGTHPEVTTKKNIVTYKRQLKSLGFSYDWSRELATSDPSYYKWTQWIFTILYEKGLAYEAEMLVNYCPALGTVLANEEVESGLSKEGGYPIERRPLRQWVLKITDYAERLLTDLEGLDWPDYLKRLQTNWIGKSSGAKISFQTEKNTDPITVFTTRHDTLFGVTFLVLAPEHPLVDLLTSDKQRKGVEAYKKAASSKSDLQRTELEKEKSGVWTGSYAIHPASGEKIPIWVADYVLAGYGTGAVMGVPGHDERDFAFIQKYSLPCLAVIDPGTLENRTAFLSGKACFSSELQETANDPKIINSSSPLLTIDGMNLDEAKEAVADWLETSGSGERCVNYKLRDWLFSRQRYWGEPFPILHFQDGSKRTLDISELPLCPPELLDFKPTESGESPLSRVPKWVHITDPKTGQKAIRETNTMPQWAGSCWYYLRFCDPLNEKKAWDKEKEAYWLPVDLYVGGVEHAVLHLLYSRFWHKVLFDAGLVSTSEPFQMLRNQGLVTSRSYRIPGGVYLDPQEVEERGGEYYQKGTAVLLDSQIEKMSKSKLNGTTPDEMIEDYGADTLRLYEMFMAPFEKEKVWNHEAAHGCHRFLRRFYEMAFSEKVTEEETEEGLRLGHCLVASVEKDIEHQLFNTAIAKMMEFINAFTKLDTYPKSVIKMVTQALAPFAPHIAEEIWEHLGGAESIAYAPFPIANPVYLEEKMATYVLQVNGKLRGKWDLPKDRTKEEILALAEKDPRIAKYLEAKITNVIFIPNKLLNIVTG